MTKYDDASWHSGENFPKDVPPKNAATHIGMFLNWCISQDFQSDELNEDAENDIESLRKREITGADFVLNVLDGKFSEYDLNDLGNAFARDYYVDETDFSEKFSSFATDYVNLFDDIAEENDFEYETFYHIEDTYRNYDLMRQIIDHRFAEWQEYKNLN